YKRIREAALRFEVEEEADLEDVVAEIHNYGTASGGAHTFTVQRAPIASLTSLVVIKRAVESVLRGAVPGTQDALDNSSVYEIESVKAGSTTYVAGTDFVLADGEI